MQTSFWAACTALALVLSACSSRESSKSAGSASTAVAIAVDTLRPALVSAAVLDDSDDPAIWIDTVNPSRSLVIGPRVTAPGGARLLATPPLRRRGASLHDRALRVEHRQV